MVAITSSSTEFVTLDEMQEHLNLVVGQWNGEQERVKNAAERWVENKIGPILWSTVTAERVVVFRRKIILEHHPVVSVTSVATLDGTAVTSYTLRGAAGLLRDVEYGDGTVCLVTYVVGRASISEDVRLATLMIVDWLWDTQQGVTPAQFDAGPGVPPDVEGRAMLLLRPYVRGPAVR